MKKARKKHRRRLARLILSTLVAGSGMLFGASAEAEVTVTNYTDVTTNMGGKITNTVTEDGNPISYLTLDPDEKILNVQGGSFFNTYQDPPEPLGFAAYNEYLPSGTGTPISGYTLNVISGTGIANLYGGYANGQFNAENNTVNISGGEIQGSVFGGYSTMGNADSNTVNISGGTVAGSVVGGYGGDPSFYGTGTANSNTVTISGGAVTGDLVGGFRGYGTADSNTVTISGGSVAGRVVGGWSAGGTASSNIVNILTKITPTALYGGWGVASGTGNTLNLAAVGVTTNGLDYFQNMNFYLPSGVANGDTMLTVNGSAATDLTGVTFGVAALSGVSLAKNDTVNLITNANGLTTDATLKTADSASLGTASFLTANNLATDTKYTLGISKKDGNTIIATVENVTEESGGGSESGGGTTITSEDRLKSPVETRAATVTLLNAGADMIASQGFTQAANAVALEAAERAQNGAAGAPAVSGFTPFAALGGSSMRAESGSHVDTKGYGINVGFAREIPNSQGKLLFGPVVEYGGGKYDSYNNDIHADGNSRYWGLGVMARQVNHDGFYYEGSVRGGRVTSDYGANFPAGRVSYDSSSNYWAAHLGLGKVFAAGKNGTVDGYLKYFYSHQSGDDTTIHIAGGNDEQASFDSVDSNRVRIGARYTHKVNDMNSFYGGLAYQYEFGGEARAHYSASGTAPSPSVKGSSGLLELGWQVKPGGPVTIDLGVTGWAGKQKGGSVQLGATWSF